MLAEKKLREGDLLEALSDLQSRIRKEPDHLKYRIFYFQLLVLLGRWQPAAKQLDLLEKLDKTTYAMVHTYRAAISCEVLRGEIFAGQQTPLILGAPPPWIALLVEALRLTSLKKYNQAALLRNQAFDQAKAVPGRIDGQPFEWLADADSRLGPVLELIFNGRYYWVPFEQIRSIKISPPEDLRDLAWLPVEFVRSDGGQAVGLMPTRYPGSEIDGDDNVKLARTTNWRVVAPELHHGIGQRMWATDQDDYPLLQTRSINFG